MAERNLRLDRRRLLAGIGAAAIWRTPLAAGAASEPSRLALAARPGTTGPGSPDGLIWTADSGVAGRLGRGDRAALTFANELPVPALLNWHGLDGIQAIEPLMGHTPLLAGLSQDLQFPARQAGTFLCDLRLLGDGQGRPARATALMVGESESYPVDRDELILVEDWRLRPDGTALAPGRDAGDASRLHTINGEASQDFAVRGNERVRFRFVNGCQRAELGLTVVPDQFRAGALHTPTAEPG
jgi:FtsP/CotA-like multicopper oxidase with cupredoxin domain